MTLVKFYFNDSLVREYLASDEEVEQILVASKMIAEKFGLEMEVKRDESLRIYFRISFRWRWFQVKIAYKMVVKYARYLDDMAEEFIRDLKATFGWLRIERISKVSNELNYVHIVVDLPPIPDEVLSKINEDLSRRWEGLVWWYVR